MPKTLTVAQKIKMATNTVVVVAEELIEARQSGGDIEGCLDTLEFAVEELDRAYGLTSDE